MNLLKVKVTICYVPVCSAASVSLQYRVISMIGAASESIARIPLTLC